MDGLILLIIQSFSRQQINKKAAGRVLLHIYTQSQKHKAWNSRSSKQLFIHSFSLNLLMTSFISHTLLTQSEFQRVSSGHKKRLVALDMLILNLSHVILIRIWVSALPAVVPPPHGGDEWIPSAEALSHVYI